MNRSPKPIADANFAEQAFQRIAQLEEAAARAESLAESLQAAGKRAIALEASLHAERVRQAALAKQLAARDRELAAAKNFYLKREQDALKRLRAHAQRASTLEAQLRDLQGHADTERMALAHQAQQSLARARAQFERDLAHAGQATQNKQREIETLEAEVRQSRALRQQEAREVSDELAKAYARVDELTRAGAPLRAAFEDQRHRAQLEAREKAMLLQEMGRARARMTELVQAGQSLKAALAEQRGRADRGEAERAAAQAETRTVQLRLNAAEAKALADAMQWQQTFQARIAEERAKRAELTERLKGEAFVLRKLHPYRDLLQVTEQTLAARQADLDRLSPSQPERAPLVEAVDALKRQREMLRAQLERLEREIA